MTTLTTGARTLREEHALALLEAPGGMGRSTRTGPSTSSSSAPATAVGLAGASTAAPTWGTPTSTGPRSASRK